WRRRWRCGRPTARCGRSGRWRRRRWRWRWARWPTGPPSACPTAPCWRWTRRRSPRGCRAGPFGDYTTEFGRKTMGLRRFLIHQDAMGLHSAIRIFIGTTAVWLLLRFVGDANPIWAVISVIVVTEPQLQTAWLTIGSRIANTLIGCTTGLIFL